MLRTICGKKWEDFISYSELFDTLNTRNIELYSVEILVRKRRLEFLSKILSMKDSRLIKKIAFSDTVQGKRKPGRPLLSWRQCITQDLKKFNITDIPNMDKQTQNKKLKLKLIQQKCKIADSIWKQNLKEKRAKKKKSYKLVVIKYP